MRFSQPLDQFPLWALFVATAVVFLLAIEVGFHIGRYRRSRRAGDQKSQVGSVMAASLGLLAFFLAFTFGMAGSRFDDRKKLVLEEANTIGTTYLRAELLPEPHRTEIQTLLREYIDIHAARVTTGLRNRIPVSIWVTLYFVAFLSMSVMGYHAGLTGTRSLTANLPLVFAFSAVMLLITHLERPEQKLFNVSQQAMINLESKLSSPSP